MLEFPLSDEQIKEIQVVYPEIVFTERPTIKLKCVPLNAYTKSPNLSGAVLFADVFGAANEFDLPIGHEKIRTKVIIEKCGYRGSKILGIKVSLNFSDNSKKKTRNVSNIIKEWKFPLCNLDDFEWFKKYFAPLNIDYLNKTGVAAHNGIYCGNAAFFCCDDFKDVFTFGPEKAITAIILLKDKYRPALDISRDNIRNLSIEAACDLLIIRKQLSTQDFPFTGTMGGLDIMHSFIPNGEYLKLLKNRTDFVERLRFSTSEGTLSAAALDEENKKGQCIEFTGWPMLKHITFILREYRERKYRENDLYDLLCVAYLRSKYLLRVNMSDPDSKVYIEKKPEGYKDKTVEMLPPNFFLETPNGNAYLTSRSAYDRRACNASHSLSQFLMADAEQLQQRVPGLFSKMLHSLAVDDSDKIISVVNDTLDRMRRLPNIGVSVPADLRLSQKDFC